MHFRDVKDIESIKKKTLTFHAGLVPKIHFGILTTNLVQNKLYNNTPAILFIDQRAQPEHVMSPDLHVDHT